VIDRELLGVHTSGTAENATKDTPAGALNDSGAQTGSCSRSLPAKNDARNPKKTQAQNFAKSNV